ncbi:MAG: hypothetical protein GC159_14955 [Phycisphaera sp.]|nr:hypothetical protein [Phycisphaera sp.]
MSQVRFNITTAITPGAIAIVQLHGAATAVGDLVEALTGDRPTVRSRLVDMAGIDEGLVVGLRDDWVQLMPHGGVRVVQRLAEKLRELGAVAEPDASPRDVYPEASSDLEADMLATLARAASPAAIDRLLAQPRCWADALAGDLDVDAVMRHSNALDRLVTPPTVVLVGMANVGKSTLSNWVMGRASSITADLPGTTRDWVAGLAELPTPIGELAVRWIDTPGLRGVHEADAIEQRAIDLARRVITDADVLISVRDPATSHPAAHALPRRPDVYVINKADLLSADDASAAAVRDPGVVRVSALRGEGVDELASAIVDALGIDVDVIDAPTPWAFSEALRGMVQARDVEALRRYAGVA